MRRRLAGFARTLRSNGFRVGLAETSDALAMLASPVALSARRAQAGAACAVLRDPFGLGAVRRNLRCVLARRRHAPAADFVGRPRRKPHAGAPACGRRMSRKKRSAFPIGSNAGTTRAPSTQPMGAAAAKAPRAPKPCRRPISATSLIRTMSRRRMRWRRGLPAPCGRGLFAASRSGAAAAASICGAPFIAMCRTAAR